MKPIEPLALSHSWPLFERAHRFDLSRVAGCPLADMTASALPSLINQELARRGVGLWECDLSDDSLVWSAGVFDIFGLSRDARVRRDDAVALYADDSRAMMERLRAYAIKHRRGFTIDAEIRPASGRARWMRLTAAPVCDGDRVVRLQGVKQLL